MSQTQSQEFPLRQLPQLLRETWNQHREKTDGAVVRIASFNLLVVSMGETDEELASVIRGLETSHPSRLLWAKLKPEKAWADSTAYLNLVTDCEGQQVCSEQIILRCGNEPARIPSILLPLIHSGLPTHLLWWKAGPLSCPLFTRLVDRCRLVLWQPDGSPTRSDLELLSQMWSDRYQLEHAVYPMAWHRIQTIRRRLAQAYDGGPFEVQLSDPESDFSLPNQLIEGWLSSRLGPMETLESGISLQRTVGDSGCRLLQDSRTEELGLLDHLSATRIALDNVGRDDIFAQTLIATVSQAWQQCDPNGVTCLPREDWVQP